MSEKRRKRNLKNGVWLPVCIMIAALIFSAYMFFGAKESIRAGDSEYTAIFEEKMKIMEESIFADADLESKVAEALNDYYEGKPIYHVFISLSDGVQQAKVFNAQGHTLERAYNNVYGIARNFVYLNNFTVEIVKLDFVDNMFESTQEEINTMLANTKIDGNFPFGIAFDKGFNTALMQIEIYSNKIANYDDDKLKNKRLNTYLGRHGRVSLESLPDDVILFTTRGFVYDDGLCLPLEFELTPDYGRRFLPNILDASYIDMAIQRNVDFLMECVDADPVEGKFIYGLWPLTGNENTNYNILRHAGALWAFVNQYAYSGDEIYIPYMDSTIAYLKDAVVYQDAQTAYVVEYKANEIKLGGNGISICMLVDYYEATGDDQYNQWAIEMGNGILNMLDMDTGKYYHVFYYGEDGFEDFSEKEAYRTIYYDGEATYALCSLYRLTGDEKWLTAAARAVDHFIEADYMIYRDHWVAYAMNEITKYIPSEEYYTFGLRNAWENLEYMHNYETGYFTYLELLMATFNLYDRMMEEGIEIAYLDTFDGAAFVNTIHHRVRRMLTFYFYPEFAMYSQMPGVIDGVVFVKRDFSRVRIDDIQHFAGGYLSYLENYDNIKKYE